MENQNPNNSFSYSDDAGNMQPVSNGLMHKPPPVEFLSLEEQSSTGSGQTFISQERLTENRRRRLWRVIKRPFVVAAVILLIMGAAALTSGVRNRSEVSPKVIPKASHFGSVKLPLRELLVGKSLNLSGGATVTINGALQLNDYLQLTGSVQPTGARPGQIYYDQTLNQLAYYNGSEFVFLTGPTAGIVQSLGGAVGQLTLGEGLSLTNNQLTNGGVISVQGQNGAVTFTAGAGMVINGTQFSNNGVISITSSNSNLTVTSDGEGNVTLSVNGGTGTITSTGGTAGVVPMFTAAQNVENSIISQAGLAVTVGGDLTVTGNLSLNSPLSVSQGGTGATSLTANGVLVGNGTSAITSVAAGGAGLCLLSTLGTPTWGVCPGGGVTSLNSLTGALSIANASAAGSTITINDASTAAKGIASFNSTNFSVSSGAVNTIQNIHSSASPTFAGISTNAITPSGTLTVGATGQALLLQGNASTTLTAGNGGNATTVSFQSPTANVTYRFLTATAGTYDICTTTGNCTGIGGGVTSPGGSVNRLAKFSSGQAIADSSITDDGTNVLTSIDLVIQGGDLTVGVPTTQTGTINLANNGSGFLGSIVQGALSADRTYTLPDTGGTFCMSTGNCAGGVTSLNGLIGALTIANASAAGSTITIDDATTTTKGIASFNSTNFSVSGGAVNTIQAINTGATPTFAGLNTNTITPSGAFTVGATSQTALLRGSITTITSTGAGNDIILTSADTIELQGATNVTGSIDISSGLNVGTANAFQVAAGGDITTAGNATALGGVISAGSSSQAGSFVINDGNGTAGTLQVAVLGQATTYTLPDPGSASATICLTSGNCTGIGGGVSTGGGSTNRLAKFSGAQSIADSTITDNGTTVTTTVDLIIQGGDITVGTSSQLASLILHDGNGQTTTFQAGDSSGNLTFILPTNAGTANQCLKQSGTGNQLVWDTCDGGGGGSSATLQAAYNNGNSITTSDARDIDIVLADSAGTDSNFDLAVADGSTGFVSFSRANGAGTADPAQLLLINNLDVDRALPIGIKLQAAAGGLTTAIDATDAEIVDAINVAANNIVGTTGNIDFTNFDVAGASGDVTTAGSLAVNGGSITSTGGLTLSSAGGGNITLNAAGTIELQDNTNLTGNFDASGTLTAGTANAFQVAAGGDITSAGNATLQGGTINVGTSSQAGGVVLSDGSSNTGTLQTAALGSNRIYTLPDDSGTICLSTGNCAGAGVTLQAAYNNSTSPELVVDATRGALTVRDSSGGLGANLFEVQNNAGLTTYLGVTSSGITVTGTTTSGGNINSSGGSLLTGGIVRLDNSGNATNIGSLSLSGSISGGTTYSGSGNINTTGGALQTNSTTRIDNSGNLVNIGNITGAGALALQSGGATTLAVDTGGAAALNIGATNANALAISRAGIQTTIQGSATFNERLTVGNGGGNDYLEFTEEASNPTCAASDYRIWANSSDGRLKKCQDGTVTDLDATGVATGVTLQDAYTNGNAIATTTARDLAFTLADTAVDSNLTVTTATGSTSQTRFILADGSGSTLPSELVLIDMQDVNLTMANGLTVSVATGGAITDGLDVSDAQIVNAINIGDNNILTTSATITATELNLLDGHDVALVDTNDAVATAITGTGALNAGSITSGFGGIDVGNDAITTTGALSGGSLGVSGTSTLSGDLAANGNTTIGNAATDTLTVTAILQGGSPLVFEGATADASELTLSVATLSGDQTITLPNETGTVCLQGSTNCSFAAASGSANYIRNGTSAQTADFNITGTGTIGGTLTTNGDINIPATTSSVGLINQAGTRLIHTFGGTTNFFAGTSAGNLTLTSIHNTGVGANVLQANTSGNWNTAMGSQALSSLTTGTNNNALGVAALQNTTTGSANTALGDSTLYQNVSGNSNTAVGNGALLNSTASSNTAVGLQALLNNSTGDRNTAIGQGAGVSTVSANSNTTGSDNTYVGTQAGLASTTQRSNATAIGAYAVVNQSDSMVLGCINGTNGCTASTKVGISNTAPGFLLHVGSSGVTSGTSVARFENAGGTCTVTPNTAGGITCTSDERLKKNIESFSGAMDIINQIDIKQYNMLADTSGVQKQIGVIAQQLETVLPSLVATDKDGHKSVAYAGLSPVLLQAIKEQQLQINELQSKAEQGGLHNGDQAEFAALNVSGDTTVERLTVKSDAIFEGQVKVKEVVVDSDLSVGGHLMSKGGAPRVKSSAGEATLEGTDTAGTIIVRFNPGNKPSTELATVSFRKKYKKAPRIVLAATNAAGAKLNVYAEKSASGFTIRSNSLPISGTSYQYDYVVIESISGARAAAR